MTDRRDKKIRQPARQKDRRMHTYTCRSTQRVRSARKGSGLVGPSGSNPCSLHHNKERRVVSVERQGEKETQTHKQSNTHTHAPVEGLRACAMQAKDRTLGFPSGSEPCSLHHTCTHLRTHTHTSRERGGGGEEEEERERDGKREKHRHTHLQVASERVRCW